MQVVEVTHVTGRIDYVGPFSGWKKAFDWVETESVIDYVYGAKWKVIEVLSIEQFMKFKEEEECL